MACRRHLNLFLPDGDYLYSIGGILLPLVRAKLSVRIRSTLLFPVLYDFSGDAQSFSLNLIRLPEA
jgi:hypothetical protein